MDSDRKSSHDALVNLMHLMDRIDSQTPRKVLQFGMMHDRMKLRYVHVNTMTGNQDDLSGIIDRISKVFVRGFKPDGLLCGTQVSKIPAVHHATSGQLCAWRRDDRSNYLTWQVNPRLGMSLSVYLKTTTIDVENSSFFVFYGFDNRDDDDEPEYNLPDLTDIPDLPDVPMDPPDDDRPPDASMDSTNSDHPMPDHDDHFNNELPLRFPMTPSASSMPSVAPSPTVSDGDVEMKLLLERLHELDKKYSDSDHDPEASSSGLPRDAHASPSGPLLPERDEPEPHHCEDHHYSPTPTMESDLPPVSTPSRRSRSTATSSTNDSQDTIPYEDQDVLFREFSSEIHEVLLNYQSGGSSGSTSTPRTHSSTPTFHSMSEDPQSVYQCMTGEMIFRVDSDTDSLTMADLHHHDDKVRKADLKEIQQFIEHEVWSPQPLAGSRNVIDCTWVRRWKYKQGEKVIKSRLCCRGCFDRQKPHLLKASSVASRLSQRLLISNAAQRGWPIESYDVSAAFLRGLTFDKVDRIASELGVPSPLTERDIVITLPGNVWYFLYELGYITDAQYAMARRGQMGMRLKKCMYGLADAPYLWNLAIRHFLVFELMAIPCTYDECHFYWREVPRQGGPAELTGEATLHVDDTVFSGDPQKLSFRKHALEKRFGEVTRQQVPFVHIGVHYDLMTFRTGRGFHMHQSSFCSAITTAEVPKGVGNSDKLTAQGLSQFRAVLGALLYLCVTRADIAIDIVLLASRTTIATYADLRAANALVKRAQRTPKRGLLFPPLQGPLVLLAISDASFSTSSTSYAVEGTAVVLRSTQGLPTSHGSFDASALTGPCHLLLAQAKKAKRVSHSTSHAESLALYSVLQFAETVAMRLTETTFPQLYAPSMNDLILMESHGLYDLEIVALTDCHDLVDLLTGTRGTPQDRSQRLIILSLRERRLLRKTSAVAWVDTRDMLANALTKRVSGSTLDILLDEGLLRFSHRAEFYPAPPRVTDYSEEDLLIGERFRSFSV